MSLCVERGEAGAGRSRDPVASLTRQVAALQQALADGEQTTQ